MDAQFSIGFAVGFALGALLGYLLAERVVRRITKFGRSTIVRGCALGAGAVALVPASFPAFVLGGNFGGAWAAFLLDQWAVPFGIGFGIALVLAICVCGAALFGAVLGVVVSRALRKEHAA